MRSIVLTVIVLASLSASAQSDLESGARELFERAGELLEAGDFARAEALFRRSLEASPRASTAYNLAVTLRGMGRLIAAGELIEELRAGRYGALDPARTAEVESLGTTIAQALGELRISLSPPAAQPHAEASITLDGDEVANAALPLTHRAQVDPGQHRLRVSGVDLRTLTREFAVEPGQVLELELQLSIAEDTRPGRLTLTTQDEDAELEIVGVARGASPLTHPLAPGEYQVRIHSDYGVRDSRIVVPAGRTVQLDLTPPPPTTHRRRRVLGILAGILVAGGSVGLVLWGRNREGQPRESDDLPHVEALHRW